MLRRIEYIPASKPPRVRVIADDQAIECELAALQIEGRVAGKFART